MSDDINKPTPVPDGTKTPPDGDAETLRKELEAERAKREKAEADATAYRERFEAEKAERDARTAAARKKAEEEGQFEKLASELKAENETLKSAAAEVAALKAERDALIDAQRQELLAKFPDDARNDFKDDSLEALRKALKLIPTEQHIPTHGGKPSVPKNGAKSWAEMTNAEQIDYVRTHDQAEVNRIIADSMKR